MTLVEFLLARIGEDEKDARDWLPYARVRRLERWPERILAECEAKRRIVVLHNTALDAHTVIGSDFEQGQVWMADASLRLLALPYADHPDYDPAWRP